MSAPYLIRAAGTWSEGQVTAQWVASTRRAVAEVELQIDATWIEASRRLGSNLFDGPMCRLESCVAGTDRLHLRISPTSYKPFYGTNLARAAELYARYGEDVLANPIGLSAVTQSTDGWLLLGRRNGSVAYYPNRIHPFAGSLEPSAGDRDVNVFDEMRRELREELQLSAGDLVSLRCIGIAEDISLRQPELIFHSVSSRARREIEPMLVPQEHISLHAVNAHRGEVAAAMRDPNLTPIAAAALSLWRDLPD